MKTLSSNQRHNYIFDILATFEPVTLETLKASNSYICANKEKN